MSGRGAWELASGAKETGLVSLFKGASILNRKLEPVSVITQLKDKVVLLYFASAKIEKIDRFNKHLKEFYDIVADGSGEAPVIIFVSNDGSKEDQLRLFQERGMSESWLCVEFSAQLQDIANTFGIEMIPAIIVTDKNGKAVVKNGVEELSEVFRIVDDEARKQAYLDKWLEWRKLAGDWRVSGGYTLSGGATGSSTSAAASAAAPGDKEAMRAARLARLGAGAGGGATSSGGASSSSAGPAEVAAAAAAASSSSSAAAPAVPSSSASAAAAPRVATLADASRGYVGGTYTLAGGPVLPPPAASAAAATEDNVSHMASDGDMSPRDDADLVPPTFEEMDEENLAVLVSMGFDQESAKAALAAAKGNVDDALAMMLD